MRAVACQLGFEGVGGFGLDGLAIDMRPFDALRPSGERALKPPGYWPVRLTSARQPPRRLSRVFAAGSVHFDDACIASSQDVQSTELSVEVTDDGLLNAIVYWFDLELGPTDRARVSSAPPDARGRQGAAGSWSEGWKQAACYLAAPQYVCRGTTLRIRVTVDLARGLRFEALAEAHNPDGVRRLPLTYDSLFPLGAPPRQLHAAAAIPITGYHFAMVADEARNAAYRKAIERAVGRRRGCSALDIGAGTGLLGIMCARAGAGRVDCVEMNVTLAAVAERTLEASGVAQASVWHKMSVELQVDPTGREGPSSRADVIVSEILDSACIGEGVLHSARAPSPPCSPPPTLLAPPCAALAALASLPYGPRP